MRLSYGVCVKLTVACGMEASVLGPERPEDSEASQVMSAQVSLTAAPASLLQFGGADVASAATTEPRELTHAATSETTSRDGVAGAIHRGSSGLVPGLQDNSMTVNRPQALLDAERRMEMAVQEGAQSHEPEAAAGDGLTRLAPSSSGMDAHPGTREALLAQGRDPLDLSRSAGEGISQNSGAANGSGDGAREAIDADQRSLFTTPRSSPPTWSLLGSPYTGGSTPSPTQLPRGLRWLEGVGNFFKPAGEPPHSGSLLAPILDAPRTGYGATRADATTASYSGNGGQAPLSLGGAANQLFSIGALGYAPKGHDKPPSSQESLPHDAIQAEVARQLEGLMLRARQAEQENQLLKAQLSAVASGDRRSTLGNDVVPPNLTEGMGRELPPRSSPEPRQARTQEEPDPLARLSPQEQLRVLGDALAVKVRGYDSQYVGVIVDVLLQLSTDEVKGLLEDPIALERSVAAVQQQLGLVATTSFPDPNVTAPTLQPISLTAAPQVATQTAPLSNNREGRSSWRSSVTGMLSEIISGVQGSVGFRQGQGSKPEDRSQGSNPVVPLCQPPRLQSEVNLEHPVTNPVSFGPLTQGCPSTALGQQPRPEVTLHLDSFPPRSSLGLPAASRSTDNGGLGIGVDDRVGVGGLGSSGVGLVQGDRPVFPEIRGTPAPVTSPADPAQRTLSSSNLPVHQDPAFLTIAKSIAQLQELQKEALRTQPGTASVGSSTAVAHPEQLKPGTNDLPPLPQGQGEDLPLLFGEWLQVASCILANVSETSGEWWGLVRQSVDTAYKEWMIVDPLSRSQVLPNEAACSVPKWNRLNSRVAGMLLAIAPASLKADLVARQEVGSAARILFRLFLLYQPAGSGEKEVILKKLHAPQPAKTPLEAQQALRNWSRWEARAREVGLVLPDPSILARSLTAILSSLMGSNQDLAFKLNVARQALRLDQNPTMDRVLAYHRHALAEVDALVQNQGHGAGPQIRVVDTPIPLPKSASKPLCKFFLSEKGCRKTKCTFTHDMSGLDKPTRSRKCLRCGSEAHRAKDCTVASSKGHKRGDGTDPGSPGSQSSAASPASPSVASVQALSSGFPSDLGQFSTPALSGQVGQVPTAALSSQVGQVPTAALSGQVDQVPTAALSGQSVTPAIAVHQVSGLTTQNQVASYAPAPSAATEVPLSSGALLDSLIREAGLRLQSQGPGPSMKVLSVATEPRGSGQGDEALVDSGATHSMRPPVSNKEWSEAAQVGVKLAGSQATTLRMSPGGALLHPAPHEKSWDKASDPKAIVPLGQIVEKLGYKFEWSAASCRLISPDGKIHRLQVERGCPHMGLNAALTLIAKLEERALASSVATLREASVRTQEVVQDSRSRLRLTWFERMQSYARAGDAEEATLALQAAPFMALDDCVNQLPDQQSVKGWQLLKGLKGLTRKERKRLHSSKNWIVHLFAGDKSTPKIQVPSDCVLLPIDIRRSLSDDLLQGSVWDPLVWAAREGKIAHIIGAPPRTSLLQNVEVPDKWQEAKHAAEQDLLARMFILHSVAAAGRKVNFDARHRAIEVGFLMQYPEFRVPTSSLLTHTHGGFWASEAWQAYKEEAGLAKVQFATASCNLEVSHTWTVGTNLGGVLDRVRHEAKEQPSRLFHNPRWTEAFRDLLSQAIASHHRYARLAAMSPQAWREHLKAGHQPFYKGCRACIMGKSSGRQHRRAKHPSVDCLHVDVAGPVRVPGADPDGRGRAPLPFKYLVVGVYRYPKLEGFKDNASEEELSAAVDDSSSPYLQNEHEPPLPPPAVPPDEGVHQSSGDLEPADDTDMEGYSPSEGEVARAVGSVAALDKSEEEDSGLVGAESSNEQDAEATLLDRIASELKAPLSTEILLFASPTYTNRSNEVLAAIQEFTLWLKMHNMPLRRVHSDRSKEFLSRPTRAWLLQQGVLPTYGIPGDPRSNGSAEAGVRLVKSNARALLAGSGLPLELWPQAAITACTLQRSRQLNMSASLIAPLGTSVLAKMPKHHSERSDVDSAWAEWQYAGLSQVLGGGHVLTKRVGEKQKFLHTKNVRVPEPEPEGLFPPLEADVIPSRRVTGKQPLPSVRASSVLDESAVEARAVAILDKWSPTKARKLIVEWALTSQDRDVKVGLCRHGGVLEKFRQTSAMPNYTRLLCRMMQQYAPEATYTSLVVGARPSFAHYDAHNDPFASNVVLPLKLPLKGGHHWKELRNGDIVQGGIQPMTDSKGSTFYGTVSKLQTLVPSYLNPHHRHGVTPWEGDRVVLVGYTVNTIGRNVAEYAEWLQALGFNVPEAFAEAQVSDVHAFNSDIKMFPVHVMLPEGQQVEGASSSLAAQVPASAELPSLCSQELAQGSQSEGEPSQTREGGWTEKVVVGQTEVEFNVHWGFRVQGSDERSPCLEGPGGSPFEGTKGPRRRAPPGIRRPLPVLPEGWSTDNNPSVSRDPRAKVEDLEDSETECSWLVPSIGGVLKLHVDEDTEVFLVSDSSELRFPPQLYKTEPAYVEAPEEMLAALKEPLQVVHTVSPKDVALYPERWLSAISKELQTIEVAIQRFQPGDVGYQALLSDPNAIKIPAKLVYTLKPPTQGATSGEAQGSPLTNPENFFRRKARIVGCGNYAPRSDLEAYASGSAPEAFRMVLTESAYRRWLLGTLDIVAAFLETPISPELPPIIVSPPSILRRLNLSAEREVWRLVRALYGLRESPRLWAIYRDGLLQTLRVKLDEGEAYLKQTDIESNLWTVLEICPEQDQDVCIAYILVYVDDILIAATRKVLLAVARTLRETWKTSELCILSPSEPIRFLGLDVSVVENGFSLNQRGYVEEVIRAHGWNGHARTPVAREDAVFELKADDEAPTSESVLSAQQLAGELLWVSQRSRPDVSYASTLASSLSTRAPLRSARISQRAFLYLRDTSQWELRFIPGESVLTGYGDASFSPEGGRSHTGWTVLFRNCPIAWRSSRQTLTTLSTAEAEMIALQEAALALMATEALLESLGIFPEDKLIYSDSTSAVAIQKGSCSFRTRHLKVRATWLREQIQNGSIRLRHQPGALQLADLLTKALSYPRIRELAQLWSMLDTAAAAQGLEPSPQARRALVALVFLLSVGQGCAQPVEPEDTGIQSDASLYLFGALVALSALAVWEGVKTLVRWCVLPRVDAIPSRRAQRLRRLQEAVQLELETQLQGGAVDSTNSQLSVPQEVAQAPVLSTALASSSSVPQVPHTPRVSRASTSCTPDLNAQEDNSQIYAHLHRATPVRTQSQRRRAAAVTSTRDAQVQTEGFEYPRVVVRERVTYPPSVIVTSGSCYHLTEHCTAVRRAASSREAPMCRYCL